MRPSAIDDPVAWASGRLSVTRATIRQIWSHGAAVIVCDRKRAWAHKITTSKCIFSSIKSVKCSFLSIYEQH